MNAALLPLPQRPPHDPLWMRLGACAGWAKPLTVDAVEVEGDCGSLVLAAATGAARVLGEASGSFGGLVPPRHMAVDGDGNIWLLDTVSGRLRRFDACDCRFVTVPCTLGRGAGGRMLVAPGGIAVAGDLIFVCDAGPPGRLLVFDRYSFALRAEWRPPVGAVAAPWKPVAVVVDGGRVLVGDPNNGAVHEFARWGGWLRAFSGLGAAAAVAVDCRGRLLVAVSGVDSAIVLWPNGVAAGVFKRPAELAGDFAALPFVVAADGVIDLSGVCAGAAGFDAAGNAVPVPLPPSPAFAVAGEWMTGPLDSRIARCVWHRIVPDAAVPGHARLRFATFTAEVELSAGDIAALPAVVWRAVPSSGGDEALIRSPAGRYLWLKIVLEGDGAVTPRVCGVDIEYPRISLRRYLPAAFGSDAESGDFTDRMLALFDRGFRDLEAGVDGNAALYDADSAPAAAGRDVLGWLGSWIGLALERGWGEARRRAMLKQAGRLLGCRGTVFGLRSTLLLWLGWRDDLVPGAPACGPRCAGPWRAAAPPMLVLEHWKLRRWLFLGKGRLGSDTELWGEQLLGRSQAGTTARLGVTKLDTTRNPLLDPFNRDAHRFSVFLPAWALKTAKDRSTITRLIDDHRPAHTVAQLIAVHPRMRIGTQASVGFDTVVGCWPSGIELNAARLGRGTVLPSGTGKAPPKAIGRTARLAAAGNREARR